MNCAPAAFEVEFWSLSHRYASSKSHSCRISTVCGIWEVGIRQPAPRVCCYGLSLVGWDWEQGKRSIVQFKKAAHSLLLGSCFASWLFLVRSNFSPNTHDGQYVCRRRERFHWRACNFHSLTWNKLFSGVEWSVGRQSIAAKGRLSGCWLSWYPLVSAVCGAQAQTALAFRWGWAVVGLQLLPPVLICSMI